MKICCVGISVFDRIFTLDSLPFEEGKFFASKLVEQGGGPAATAAVACARLGACVDMIARVGDDATGKAIVDGLAKEGVNVDLMRIIKGATSTQASILVDKNGNRVIVSYPSPSLDPDASFMDSIDFSQYDVVLADVRWFQGAKKAFELARKAQVKTVLDADITDQPIDELIALGTDVVFSKPGLLNFTHETNIDNALFLAKKCTKGDIYVTLGADGYKFLLDNHIIHKSGYKVNVVDTTGAGDVFHGAYAFALASKQEKEQRLKFAAAVAALKCTKSGGRNGIPHLEQVIDFMDKN